MMMVAMQGAWGGRHGIILAKRLQPSFAAGRLLLIAAALAMVSSPALAQVNYVTRFTLDKPSVVPGEPVFCTFSIENTGTKPFAFAYRIPSRIANTELESEPHFIVRDASGRQVPDPAPRRCGGAKGTAVYGSVSLPPGQIHIERWLISQWARMDRSGTYRIRAERRLPLLGLNEAQQEFSGPPVAYAAALNEFTLEVSAPDDAKLRIAFEPYEKVLRKPDAKGFAESFEAVVTLPQSFLLDELVMLAGAGPDERRWDRERALEGLARLGTPAAWEAILNFARGVDSRPPQATVESAAKHDSFRAYAIQLMAQRGERSDLTSILAMIPEAPEALRGEMIRALGYFRDPRANQTLFERLHSRAISDRVNAILGLRNLESREVIPALIAMLNDPEPQVRQVAHFALRTLTGQPFELSSTASVKETARVSGKWRAWWQKQRPEYEPLTRPACRDW